LLTSLKNERNFPLYDVIISDVIAFIHAAATHFFLLKLGKKVIFERSLAFVCCEKQNILIYFKSGDMYLT